MRILRAATVSLALVVCCGHAAHAVTQCVTNATELQQALDNISDGGIYASTGSAATILVVKGTYKTSSLSGNNAFHYTSTIAQTFAIQGGYTGACPSPTFHTDATTSILDGDGVSDVLEIHSAKGEVNVAFLTIQNGKTGGDPAGLSVNASIGDNSGSWVRDNIQNNSSGGLWGGVFIASGGTALLEFSSNLLINNHAANGEGAGVLIGNGGQLAVYNNTVYGNTSTLAGSIGGLSVSTTNHGSVIGNIFWNNTNYDLDLDAGFPALDYNDIGTAHNPTSTSESIGNVSVAPKFVSIANKDFHLSQTSPLIGASLSSSGAIDLDGHPYPFRGKTDIGAYEETIFADGFHTAP